MDATLAQILTELFHKDMALAQAEQQIVHLKEELAHSRGTDAVAGTTASAATTPGR